ncbi:hypothetical protein EBB07_01620 [Paenibacillaceae bacterium]|nr:hypothetical protein EBB07_01620 [Paenibacillaceae bacterium]
MTHTSLLKKAKPRLMLALLLAVSLTTACGSNASRTENVGGSPDLTINENTDLPNNENNANTPANDDTDSEPAPDDNKQEHSPEGSPGDKPTNESEPTDNEAKSPDQDNPAEMHEVFKGTGVFVGQADGHTIEIETADGPIAYQHEDTLAEAIASLDPDEKVNYEYIEKPLEGEEVQRWIVTIEKTE